jgi:hypothetical protein
MLTDVGTQARTRRAPTDHVEATLEELAVRYITSYVPNVKGKEFVLLQFAVQPFAAE